MELQKIKEFGNYLLTINNDEFKKVFIDNILNIENEKQIYLFLRVLKPENDEDNNTKVIKDKDDNDITITSKSQLNIWIDCYGLIDNEETKNKLKDYLNQLLVYKN